MTRGRLRDLARRIRKAARNALSPERARRDEGCWSIAIFRGPDPLSLAPAEPGQAAIVPGEYRGRRVRHLADPFLAEHEGTWHLFFELVPAATHRGEIAVCTSRDLRRWEYHGTVLAEPFHVSYPCVFRDGDAWHLVPESAAADSVRLYRAEDFPRRWRLERELLRGPWLDPTVFQAEGRWWLFAYRSGGRLHLFSAPEPAGPWVEHPKSPVVRGDRRISRGAGAVVVHEGRRYRFAQDCEARYGSRVWAMEITRLTATDYDERPAQAAPALDAAGETWACFGMHHLCARRLANGQWVAAVDGLGPPACAGTFGAAGEESAAPQPR